LDCPWITLEPLDRRWIALKHLEESDISLPVLLHGLAALLLDVYTQSARLALDCRIADCRARRWAAWGEASPGLPPPRVPTIVAVALRGRRARRARARPWFAVSVRRYGAQEDQGGLW
jgi:hypothetical protein